MAYKGKGQQVNRANLADVFGVSLPTIDSWVRAGCPLIQRGSKGVEWTFNTADVSKWLRDRAAQDASENFIQDEAELKRRKLAAETTMAELELAKAKGEVAPLDQMERNLSKLFAEIRANMRNIPGRVVTRVIGETDERKIKAALMDEIDQVLEALASLDLAVDDPQEDEEE